MFSSAFSKALYKVLVVGETISVVGHFKLALFHIWVCFFLFFLFFVLFLFLFFCFFVFAFFFFDFGPIFKSYFRSKSIFCNKLAFDYNCNSHYFLCFVLENFLRFCKIHKFQYLWRHKHCYIMEVILMLSQILVRYMATIFNMILVQCWRLETTHRPFYHFI